MPGESSKINGLKGGRPKGSRSAAENAAIKRVRNSLQELCQRREEEHVAVLEAIAASPKEPANARIFPISLLFDRGIGKASQPEHHSSNVQLTVVTGVPEPDAEP